MNHGLSEKAVATIISIFQSFPQIERAVLYGSRAMGNYKEGSDLDFTLIGEGTEKIRGQVWNAFDDSNLPYMVDVSAFHTLTNENLKAQIEKYGVVFYERGK
jgi:predicted nucleotidyltransferase